VQGAVRDACQRVLGGAASEPVAVTGASRTDAGVHALRQVASVRTTSAMAPAVLARALNALLPPAIRVLDAAEAPAGFDARRAALGKRYAYLIDRAPVADPFVRRWVWWRPGALDVPAMSKALRALRGAHDFSAFCAAAGRDRSPICTVLTTRVIERGARLAILIGADSFLHHMVRNIVGSAVEIGRGARPAEWLGEVLTGRDRRRAGPTAPAEGLVLLRVRYPRARAKAATGQSGDAAPA
jgi:tRNA pseudouridine38-40 synthase